MEEAGRTMNKDLSMTESQESGQNQISANTQDKTGGFDRSRSRGNAAGNPGTRADTQRS